MSVEQHVSPADLAEDHGERQHPTGWAVLCTGMAPVEGRAGIYVGMDGLVLCDRCGPLNDPAPRETGGALAPLVALALVAIVAVLVVALLVAAS